MARIVCSTCGREVYTTWTFEALTPGELRCSSCGAEFHPDRRAGERRVGDRRKNPPSHPGPPDGVERRTGERRTGGRRKVSKGGRRTEWQGPGWID